MFSRAIRCSKHLKRIELQSFPRYQNILCLNQSTKFSTYESVIENSLNDQDLSTFIRDITTKSDFHFEQYSNLAQCTNPQLLNVLKMVDIVENGYQIVPDFDLHSALLEFNQKINDLQDWEKFCVSGVLSYYNKNYLKAAGLFDQALGQSPIDPLLLRLVQDCYAKAGLKENIGNCIQRYPQDVIFGSKYQPMFLGLLSFGFAENGRLDESEALSQRAFTMSARRGVYPVLSLCNSFYLQGKSSEITEVYDKNYNNFFGGEGKYQLACLRGHALIMRGNCHGAHNVILEMLDYYEGKRLPGRDPDDFHPRVMSFPLFFDTVMLLWHINIHLTPLHLISIDSSVNRLESMLQKYQFIPTEIKYFCAALLAGTKLHGYQTRNTIKQLEIYNEKLKIRKEKKAEKSSGWSFPKLFGSNSKAREDIAEDEFSSPDERGTDSEERQKPAAVTYDENEFFARSKQPGYYDQESLNQMEILKANLQNHLYQSYLKESQEEKQRIQANQQSFPQLAAVNPTKSYNPYASLLGHAELDKEYAERRTIAYENIIRGVINFSIGEYQQSVDEFNKEFFNSFIRLGLFQRHRDILVQTFGEVLLLNKQFEDARILLLERKHNVQGDGQNWVRLARLYRQLGDLKEMDKCQYLAWQNGVGQGGFGGSL